MTESKYTANLRMDNAILEAFETGNVGAIKAYHANGLDVNRDEGELLASAAENGHLRVLKIACEEMGGVLNDSKCDDTFFINSVTPEIQSYIVNRLDDELKPAEIKASPVKPKAPKM